MKEKLYIVTEFGKRKGKDKRYCLGKYIITARDFTKKIRERSKLGGNIENFQQAIGWIKSKLKHIDFVETEQD